MKRSPAIVLLLFCVGVPVYAQHGGGHGGFSGHAGTVGGGFARSSPAVHSGFGPSRPAAPSVAPRFSGNRPGYAPTPGINPNSAAAMRRGAAIRYGAQPMNYGAHGNGGAQGERRSPYRSPYRHPDRGGIVYVSPFAGSLYYGYPYGLGYYGDDSFDEEGYGDSGDSQAAYYGPDQYNGFDPEGQGQTQVWPQNQDSNGAPGAAQLNPDEPYRPYYGSPHPVSAPAIEPAVTLVFKDHRPNQQIHNYTINGDTLTVWDDRPHEITLGDLDIAATEKLNHDAGVDLYLPGAPK